MRQTSNIFSLFSNNQNYFSGYVKIMAMRRDTV